MNDSTDNIAPASGKDPISLTFDPAALARMEGEELRFLAAAIMTLLDVGSGVGCQPRFWKTDRCRNEAGDMIEELNEGLCGLLDGIYKQAKTRTATSSREAEDLAWCRLAIKAEWADGIDDFAVIAAECVRDVNAAEFREKHPRRGA